MDDAVKIPDLPEETSVSGNEILPVSANGVTRRMTVSDVKSYTLAQLAAVAAAQGVDFSADGVYLLKDGAVKPLSASAFGDTLLKFAFAKAGAAELNGNEIFAIKNGNSLQTATLSSIKDWIAAEIGAESFDIATLPAADALADGQPLAVSQGGDNKKVNLSVVKTYVLAGLYAYATEMTTGLGDNDYVFVYSGSAIKKVKKSNLGVGGDVTGPAVTTEDNIPQWDSGAKTLKNGKAVTNTVNEDSTAMQVPTAAAVFAAIRVAAGVSRDGTPTAGNIPTWTNEHTIGSGKEVATEVRASGTASDAKVPTEKAVRDALAANPADGKTLSTSIPSTGASDERIPTEKAVADKFANGVVAPPASHSEDAIPTWGASNELKAGKTVTTVLANEASDDQIPTAKAVREALPVPATGQSQGLISASDKAKLDGLPDLGAIQEIAADLDDSDTLIVKDNDSVWKKFLITRLWTYIMGKLASFKIDALAQADDTTKLDASSSRHGLCPKLSGNQLHFLNGQGAFAVPPGSDDFTGDSGAGGVHGLVPAPAAGDAAANKVLGANGQWVVPPSAAGVDIAGATPVDAPAAGDAIYVYQTGNGEYRKLTLAQLRSLIFGTERADTVFIPAGAMAPSGSDGATGGTIQFENTTHDTMIFGNSVDTSAEFSVVLPDDWNLGAIKAKVLWTVYDSTKAQAGQYVSFDLGVTASDDGDAVSDAPTTANAIVDQVLAANELHRTDASAEITPEGTSAKGSMLHFRLTRDADYAGAGSAMPTDAYVLGVLIQFKRTVETLGW